MPFGPVGKRNPLTFGARRILSCPRRNDLNEFHTCLKRAECQTREGTRGEESPIET